MKKEGSSDAVLGLKDLKETIAITDATVECPVRGCLNTVPRKRRKDGRNWPTDFRCPDHGISITPSTFEYDCELRNLLWKDPADVALINRINGPGIKRESRVARERSEDAVSWNVFRYLERNGLIAGCLASLLGGTHRSTEIIYWSHSQNQATDGPWSHLSDARKAFGEKLKHGSEPDIIIRTDSALFFVEAKFTSGNKTKPSNSSDRKYETGGDNWYAQVFNSDYRTVAIEAQKYELMRFWLLGTWMANKLGLDFHLVNLVRQGFEPNIERDFRPHIIETAGRKFKRLTWEEIHNHIAAGKECKDKQVMLDYYQQKTAGYSNGVLKKAFSLKANT